MSRDRGSEGVASIVMIGALVIVGGLFVHAPEIEARASAIWHWVTALGHCATCCGTMPL